ncbi:serine hydrolase domain-containing protein [Paenibacillus roseipurpureus]|uniref:Serine hydrolase n=1 Tax=Paenibacillus roseopurpureus TaxID=2918901 RepID=A0AA96LWJ8_9BACL|nr:serine hydrolase [Paenibacillus sp. MBLB1832]WNR45985.1 serine hydrolase [Paenibacillus sp. MBLB1832]
MNTFEEWVKVGLATGISVAADRRGVPTVRYVAGEVSGQTLNNDSLFNVGSVTKPITAALLMKLLELGEITLHDPVQRFIPEFRFSEVELLHLLVHTAGFDENTSITWPKSGTEREYLNAIYAIDRLGYPMGERNVYFSFGYSILMDVLERVSGCSLEMFARMMLFEPLGMECTTFSEALTRSAIVPLHPDTMETDADKMGLGITGDSGLYSNPEELLRFGQMLLQGGEWEGKKIYAESTVDLMFREVTGGVFGRTPVFWKKTERDLHRTTNIDVHRCFADLHTPNAVGHNGFSGCMFAVDPGLDSVIVICTGSQRVNSDGRNYKRLMNQILSLG